MNFQFNDIEARGILKPEGNTQPGEYDIEASFYCLNKEQWYIFRDKQSFRVFLKGERQQFVSAKKLAWIAIIISIISIIISITPRQELERVYNHIVSYIRRLIGNQ